MVVKTYFSWILFAAFSLQASNCNNRDSRAAASADTNLDEARKAIAESNAIYFESFKRNDSSIFINRYAEDACIMPPNAGQLCGHEGAAKFFRMAYQDYGLRNGKFHTTAVYGDAVEFVMEEGVWQSFNEKDVLLDDGKFLVLWKKTGEGWKMYRDSFSSNHAAK